MERVIKYYHLSWYRKLAIVKSYKADVSSISPSSERMECFVTLYGGQFTLSTQLVILNYPVTLSHRRSNTISLETDPLNGERLMVSCVPWEMRERESV